MKKFEADITEDYKLNDEAGSLQDNIFCENDEPKSKCSSFHKLWKEVLDSADESNDSEFMEEDCLKQGNHKKKVKEERNKECEDTETSSFDGFGEEAAEQNEKNRYCMPEYFKWLHAKIPCIVMLNNILLGDQNCHSNNYNNGEVGKGPRNFLDLNTTNVYD